MNSTPQVFGALALAPTAFIGIGTQHGTLSAETIAV